MKKMGFVDKLFGWAFTHPVGIAASSLAMGGGTDMKESLMNSKPLSRITPPTEQFENDFNTLNNKIGSTKMPKTLLDVIRERRAKVAGCAKGPAKPAAPQSKQNVKSESSTKTMKVGSADVTLANQLVDNLNNVKTAGVGGRLAGLLGSEGMPSVISALNMLGLGTIGAMGASTLYGTAKDAVKKELAYHQMFEEFPELAEMPRTQVDKYWSVLDDFAPKLTTNPLVAGQFISNMASYGMRGIDHNVVGQLAQISGHINQGSGGLETMKALAGLGTKAYDNDFNALTDSDWAG